MLDESSSLNPLFRPQASRFVYLGSVDLKRADKPVRAHWAHLWFKACPMGLGDSRSSQCVNTLDLMIALNCFEIETLTVPA